MKGEPYLDRIRPKTLLRPPRELDELRRPWFSNGTDPKVESWVRHGSRPAPTGLGSHGTGVVSWMSGGGGTVMTEEATPEQFASLKTHMEEEYFREGGPAAEAHAKLTSFLGTRSVTLSLEHQHTTRPPETLSPEVYALTLKILEALPEWHLGHSNFTTLWIGGWGNGAAKYSEYSEPAVHMFECAISGPKRNYIALLLHEVGHSFHHMLGAPDRKRLEGLSLVARPLIGIDYLGGSSERLGYQDSASEFIAENYLNFVARGPELEMAAASLSGRRREAWTEVLDIYVRNFGMMMYI
ncbi:MAG: hypothetical protein AB1529_01555 [Candidatus Micrarchaeota archaeon]